MTSGVLYDLLAQMYTYAPAQESPKDAVFAAERAIILDVARKGSCVIVGRCSDWILRDDPHCLRLWIQASEQARIARIMEYDRCDAAAARAIMAKGDRRRAVYYQYYTRRVWGLARNFHLAVDNHARLRLRPGNHCRGPQSAPEHPGRQGLIYPLPAAQNKGSAPKSPALPLFHIGGNDLARDAAFTKNSGGSIDSPLFDLVAEAGLEPTTFGL